MHFSTKCPICENKVYFQEIHIQEERIGTLRRDYWSCPHCGFEYTILLKDEAPEKPAKKGRHKLGRKKD